MAVYTEVSAEQVAEFLSGYDVGRLVACKGMAEGVENTNYLLTTDRAAYILTLYEKRVAPADLPFFLGLMEHLAARGITCPVPIRDREGRALRELAGRPAALFSFLSGLAVRRPGVSHCGAVGGVLARLHEAGRGFALTRANDLSLAGWRALAEAVCPRADEIAPGLAAAIAGEVAALTALWPAPDALPLGIIHADLFPDNVFFLDGQLSGVIDFYFACTDWFAYDLAICLNAWCFEADNSFNVTKARALLHGYDSVRVLEQAEIEALPILARGAALRFLLTRAHDWFHNCKGALVRPKDPLEYWRKLRFHQSVSSPGDYGL